MTAATIVDGQEMLVVDGRLYPAAEVIDLGSASIEPLAAIAEPEPPTDKSADYTLTESSLHITDERMGPDRWLAVLEAVVPENSTRQWYIGDLLAFGEKKFGEQSYELAAEALGYEHPGSLRNLVYISRAVPPEVREPSLSHKVHRVVAKMDVDDQRQWLKAAVENGWKSTELQRQIAAAAESDTDEGAEGGGGTTIEMPEGENDDFDAEQHWRAGGMPNWEPPVLPYKIIVSFDTEEDKADFYDLVGSPAVHQRNGKTTSVWWPDRPKDDVDSVRFVKVEEAA
jgi:hypothetical protein